MLLQKNGQLPRDGLASAAARLLLCGPSHSVQQHAVLIRQPRLAAHTWRCHLRRRLRLTACPGGRHAQHARHAQQGVAHRACVAQRAVQLCSQQGGQWALRRSPGASCSGRQAISAATGCLGNAAAPRLPTARGPPVPLLHKPRQLRLRAPCPAPARSPSIRASAAGSAASASCVASSIAASDAGCSAARPDSFAAAAASSSQRRAPPSAVRYPCRQSTQSNAQGLVRQGSGGHAVLSSRTIWGSGVQVAYPAHPVLPASTGGTWRPQLMCSPSRAPPQRGAVRLRPLAASPTALGQQPCLPPPLPGRHQMGTLRAGRGYSSSRHTWRQRRVAPKAVQGWAAPRQRMDAAEGGLPSQHACHSQGTALACPSAGSGAWAALAALPAAAAATSPSTARRTVSATRRTRLRRACRQQAGAGGEVALHSRMPKAPAAHAPCGEQEGSGQAERPPFLSGACGSPAQQPARARGVPPA